MTTEVRVPGGLNSEAPAVLSEWLVAEGSEVQTGDILGVLETSKASVDVEAPAAGIIAALLAQPGDEVESHSVIATIGVESDRSSARSPLNESAESATTPRPASPSPAPSGLRPSDTTPLEANARRWIARTTDRAISPRAQVFATRNQLNLTEIRGSGPGGRIILVDAIRARDGQLHAAQSEAAPNKPTIHTRSTPGKTDFAEGPSGNGRHVSITGVRAVIAQRMTQSATTIPQVTLMRRVPVTALVEYQARLQAAYYRMNETELADGSSADPLKITLTHLIAFAVTHTLLRYPNMNATTNGETIVEYPHVDLGIAVDTGSGLIVPVIDHADNLSVAELARSITAVARRAREGSLRATDMGTGTFTISNLGAFGVEWFNPLINPPQVAILGVGAISQGDTPELPVSLTFDHRTLDGAAAARFLATLATALDTIEALASR